MDNRVVFIVTRYGCDSMPSSMWVPESKIFTNYEEAYNYFVKVSPPLDDEYNIAEQFINVRYNKDDMTKNYIMIENRVQVAGYHCEEDCSIYAKRPRGAVIVRSIIE